MLGEQLLWVDGIVHDRKRFYLSDHVPVLHEYRVGTRLSHATTR